MGVLIDIDDNSKIPIFRQIISQMIERIDTNDIKPGIRLPSTRAMADKLDVNRSTVYKAYQELWSLGYLESRPGSYTTVRNRTKIASKQIAFKKGLIDLPQRINERTKKVYSSYVLDEFIVNKTSRSNIINFIPLSPDSRLLPIEGFRKCINHVLINKGPDLLQYGSSFGYEPLRKCISERMCEHSVSVSPDEIMITAGAQNGIELILRLFAKPGSSVAVESPTYSRVIDILRLHDVNIIEIPMSQNGMDLQRLEKILATEKPAIVYTIPNFHNPTGFTTGQIHREKLLAICEHHQTPLVEDGFEEEMKYFGKAVLPIKSMDRNGIVFYIGSFSKVLFPGIRIGWIAAEKEYIDYLVSIQRTSAISVNLLSQAALSHFCRAGFFELHIKRIHRVYKKRMQKAINAIQTYLNDAITEYSTPLGGYTIWLSFKGILITEMELFEHLIEEGVAILPGSIHFGTPTDKLFIRISIAHVNETEIEEGIRRLATAIERLYKKNGH